MTRNGDGFEFLPAATDGKVLVAESNTWVEYSLAESGDISVTIDSTNNELLFDVLDGAINSSEIANDAIQLIHIDDATFADGSMSGRMLYWGTDENPAVLDIGSNGEILTVTNGIPAWETAGSNTTININDGNANGDANFGILFGSEADLGAGVADTVYVDGATDNYGLSYNPSITSVSHASEGSEAVGNNNAAGLFSKFGFAGDLAGTATSAKYVETTNAGTDAATYYP